MTGILCGSGLLLALAGIFFRNPQALMLGGGLLISGLATGLLAKRMDSYRFTLWILLASFTAMLFPEWFKSIGGFNLANPWLMLLLVQSIMFGMGTQMSIHDFVNVASMPSGVLAGLACQFLVMPLLGYMLAHTFQLPPEIGAGLILIGSCSSGLASNVMTFLAKGNLALSVTLTVIATTAAPIMTPLWMRSLAASMIDVDAVKMSLEIVKMVLVPILAAFIHDFLASRNSLVSRLVWCLFVVSVAWLTWLALGGWSWMLSLLDEPDSVRALGLLSLPGFVAGGMVVGCLYHIATEFDARITEWMPRISMFGIVYFTLVATAQGRDHLLAVGLMLLIAVTLHNLLGLTIGYWISRALGMNEQDARTVAIEVGSQNAAMATGLAQGMGKLGTVGLAAVIFAPLMNVTGSLAANYWRNRPFPTEAETDASQ